MDYKKHYNSIVKRGLITPDTTLLDFIMKIKEEYNELFIELIGSSMLTSETKQECMDLVAVIFNMLLHYGVDIEHEFEKNINKQLDRCKNM